MVRPYPKRSDYLGRAEHRRSWLAQLARDPALRPLTEPQVAELRRFVAPGAKHRAQEIMRQRALAPGKGDADPASEVTPEEREIRWRDYWLRGMTPEARSAALARLRERRSG